MLRVVADFVGADGHELLAGGELVDVEGDLLGSVNLPCAAGVNRILFSLLGAGVIPVTATEHGWGGVGLFDAAEHFGVEFFLKGLGGRHDGIGVGVLGFEVGADGGVFLFAEPEVIVDASVAVDGDVFRLFLRERRLRGVKGELGGGGESGHAGEREENETMGQFHVGAESGRTRCLGARRSREK